MTYDDDSTLWGEMWGIIATAKKYRDIYGEDRYNGAVDFTLEKERGETYSSDSIALYGHRDYEPGSVLEGSSCRFWIGNPSPGFYERLPDDLKAITAPIDGTTHTPLDQVVAHLPDEDDMPGGSGLDDLPDLGYDDRHG